jgi:hypothetical protein
MSESKKKTLLIRKNNPEKRSKEERFEKIVESMMLLVNDGFTGYLRINFSQGTIGRVEKFEEILKTKNSNDR